MSPRIVPAEPHGPIHMVLPGVHVVQGTMRFGPVRFSRLMVVIEREGDLVLINTLRLDEAGLATLDALGRVTDVVRLAGGHGRDDPFYKQRYGATVWNVAGQRYFEGTRWDRGATYFEADRQLVGPDVPPLPEARLVVFETRPPEAVMLLPHGGGTLVAGDAIHNWAPGRGHFNWLGRLVFGAMGFVGPYRLGRGWLDQGKPDPEQLRELLALPFDNVLPGHGDPVIGGARALYRPAIEAYAAR